MLLCAALKQDFTSIHGGWNTAAKLGSILCQSCVGLDLPKVKDYKETFLPDAVENILTLAAKLLDFYVKTGLVSVKGFNSSFFGKRFQNAFRKSWK